MIYLSCSMLNLIGDCLAALPFIKFLSERHGGVVVVDGFCEAVRPLLQGSGIGIQFREFLSNGSTSVKRLDISEVFSYCNFANKQAHMAQGWFAVHGEEAPGVPITLPLRVDISGGEIPFGRYAAIAPFSRSDHENNKLWPLDRWAVVGRALLDEGLVREVCVVGAAREDWDIFEQEGFMCYKGWSLPTVLGLLSYANVVLTVDNGISHLCHFGGVDKHFLLQPQCLTQAFVANPRGKWVRGDPKSIGIDAVLGPVRGMLS